MDEVEKAHAWSVRQDRAICLLNETKSYLIIKRPQADLITGQYKLVTHRAGKYTAKDAKWEDETCGRN